MPLNQLLQLRDTGGVQIVAGEEESKGRSIGLVKPLTLPVHFNCLPFTSHPFLSYYPCSPHPSFLSSCMQSPILSIHHPSFI